MTISSPVFDNEGAIPVKYTCDSENISPPLRIDDIPQVTQSLVLIVDDPDAPNGTFTHWIVWNIDPTVTEVAENAVPTNGVEGMNDSGKSGYMGPCPPGGTHRYFFYLYALDQLFELEPLTTVDELRRAMEGHIIEESVHMGTYAR